MLCSHGNELCTPHSHFVNKVRAIKLTLHFMCFFISTGEYSSVFVTH